MTLVHFFTLVLFVCIDLYHLKRFIDSLRSLQRDLQLSSRSPDNLSISQAHFSPTNIACHTMLHILDVNFYLYCSDAMIDRLAMTIC